MTEHPYQLRRIELQDFKSVAQASVDLRPLTVVVGANSSGKSTLLQSILAVTQAVRSGTSTAEFPLNGEFVRLGTFEETRNFLTARPGAPIEVAFELLDTLGAALPPTPTGSRGQRPDPPLTQLAWRAYIDGVPGDDHERSGFARLTSLQIEVASLERDSGEEQGTLVLSCDVDGFGTDAADAKVLPVVSRRLRVARSSAQSIAASGRVQDWESGESRSVDAVVLAGGVPQALLRRVAQFDRLAELWWSVAQEILSEMIIQEGSTAAQLALAGPDIAAAVQASSDLGTLGRDSASAGNEAPTASGVVAELFDRELYRRISRLNPEERGAVAKSMVQLGFAQFRGHLREELADEVWLDDEVLVELEGPAGSALWRTGFMSQRFFRTSVRYLGPLREAPHVLYDPGPSKLDLGVRGEYSAAVLHAQARTRVLMPTPEGAGEERPLSDALDFWLREFDLAESARSEDRGRIGIGLSVTPKGIGSEVDLTSVGVGVSQVLPVVLLCLLAEPGTLVILEQPELHLHPKLQQDLADFLLACTRAGRQLVIETHSEHLVNRLRYQIAKDETDETHGLIRIVFAENEDGITSYREPAINPYGGLGDDWPTGFLDLTARESQELVRQSLAKRKRSEPTSAS